MKRQYKPTTYNGNRRYTYVSAYRNKKRTERQVKAAIKNVSEKKGMDTVLNTGDIISTLNTNDQIYPLNLIQQGSGSNNRIGRKIQPLTLRIRGLLSYSYIAAPTTGIIEGNLVRMTVVYDKQPNGILPSWNTIFGYTTQDGTESQDLQSSVRYDNMSRFRVLKDCIYELVPKMFHDSGSDPRTIEHKSIDEYLKLKVGETVYNDTANPLLIDHITTGSILVSFRSETNQLNNDCYFIGEARLRYLDI